jgi:hypothetical protein
MFIATYTAPSPSSLIHKYKHSRKPLYAPGRDAIQLPYVEVVGPTQLTNDDERGDGKSLAYAYAKVHEQTHHPK